ncbi:hypothetical protein BDC45DRAFT_552742 [Circinella umbellata]|nr:hypothetical protein BDC45DRAFT_552742 [Circinella umbellata]
MIFVTGSIMKANLRFHIRRTSNYVESFHSISYTLIRGGQPLRRTLRQALKIAKSELDDLSQFYEYGMLTTYNRQPGLRKSRKIGTNNYAQSDSRVPDNTDSIFGDEKQKAAIQQPIDATKVGNQRVFFRQKYIKPCISLPRTTGIKGRSILYALDDIHDIFEISPK